jgi:O-antigen/teichoic acid export membrane protein
MSLRKISKNTAWLLLEKLVRSVMTIFVGALVVRHLGPDQYGLIAYAVAIIAIFQSIASLGLEGVIVREILASDVDEIKTLKNNKFFDENIIIKRSDNKPNVQLLITSTFTLRLLSGIVLLVLAALTTGILQNWSLTAITLTILMGGPLIFQAADIFDLWNQSRLNSRLTAILKILSYLISNGLRIILVKMDADILWFAVAFFVEAFVIGFGLYLAYTSSNRLVYDYNAQLKIVKNLIKETWPVIIASLSAAVYSRFDQITLEIYLGPKDLGIYSAALLFATASYFIPGIICASVMPEAVRAKQKSVSEYIRVLRLTYLFLFLSSLVVCGLTYAASAYIFSLFYTKEFDEGVEILRIYAMANIPVYLGVAHGIWMVADKKLTISIYRALLGAITAIVLCLQLVPIYGMAGAAYSTVAALIVADIIVPIALNSSLFNSLLSYRNGEARK